MERAQLNTNNSMQRFKNLCIACHQYPEIVLSYENRPKFSVEKNYNRISQQGFIEKFGLSKEQQKQLKLLRENSKTFE